MLVLACGYVIGDAYDLTPGMLTLRPPVETPSAYPTPNPTIEPPNPLPSWDSSAPYNDDAIRLAVAEYAAAPAVGGHASVEVRDALTGHVIVGVGTETARTPASNTKVLTAAAALSVLGPETRLATSARLDGTTLYLVGGGDTLLAEDVGDATAINGRAGLADLAEAAVKAQTLGEVNLVVDSSAFTGDVRQADSLGPDSAYVMELRPLAVNQSRNAANAYQANPDLLAGEAFARALEARGVNVASVTRGEAPAAARELAKVESAPVRDLVDFMLTRSDNTTAEVLGHLVGAKAGKTADFSGGAAATLDAVKKLGVTVEGLHLNDNSGLSPNNKITTDALLTLHEAARVCDGCALEAMVSGLPVGGYNGTLAHRYSGTGAAGNVRAKTGTLVEAVSLSGFVWTSKGRLLEFAVLTDGIQEGLALEVRAQLDALMEKIAAA